MNSDAASLPLTVPAPAQEAPDATPPDNTPATPDTANDPFRTGDWMPSPEVPESPELPTIPGFLLEKELGRGGMGVVYRARQMPLGRPVALKMILAGDHASTDAKTRFLTEAEAIAKLRHPGIVQVFEFGTHQGNPYFALEFIDGGSLDRTLAKGPLLPQDAARLVAQLADAIHAAHQSGIVHRDLKPANVLLSFSRESKTSAPDSPALDAISRLNNAVPKITDFGLAKQIDAGPGLTATGAIMGTPSYMAPEQAAGKISDIGPATDVYALGAILYECLTSRPPFRGATAFDTLDMVLRQEPIPVRQLQPKVSKDLETICHKCLQKEQAQRYASAQALADDLRNYLDGKPITARPVGRLERTWKWCRRYPAIAALMVVSTLAALVASGLAAWAFREKERAEIAESETRKESDAKGKALTVAHKRLGQVEKGIELIAGILYGINPQNEGKDGPSLYQQLRDKAVRAAEQLDAEAVGDPLVVAYLQLVLGHTLLELGEYPTAIAVLQKAHATRKNKLSSDDPDTLRSVQYLAVAYSKTGKLSEAIHLLKQVRSAWAAKRGPNHPETLAVLHDLAVVYLHAGELSEATRLFEEVRAAMEAKLGPDHPKTLDTLGFLAIAYEKAGKLPEAIRLHVQVLASREAKLGPNHVDILAVRTNLAVAYHGAGKLPEAIRLYEQVRAIQEAKLGHDHPRTLTTLGNLATAYSEAGKLPEAIRINEQIRTISEAKLGLDHPDTLVTLGNLASNYREAGKLSEAIRLYEQTSTAQITKLGPDHPNTLITRHNLACVYWSQGKLDKSVPLLEDVLKRKEAKLGRHSPTTQDTVANLGVNYKDAGRLAEALPMMEEALASSQKYPGLRWVSGQLFDGYVKANKSTDDSRWFQEAMKRRMEKFKHQKATLGANHPDTLSSMQCLLLYYEATGKQMQVLQFQEELFKHTKTKLGPDHPETLADLHKLAKAYQAAGNYTEAIKHYEQLYTRRKSKLPTDHADVLLVQGSLALAHLRNGEQARALQLWAEIAAVHMKKLPEQIKPQDWQALDHRAHLLARFGKWKASAADYAAMIKANPGNHSAWLRRAQVLAASGDIPEHARHCQAMLKRFGNTTDAPTAERTAKACLVVANPGLDLKPVVRLAELAVTGTEKQEWYSYFLVGHALAYYRSGDYAAALQCTEKCLRLNKQHYGLDVHLHLLLALSQHGLGRHKEALEALTHARNLTKNYGFTGFDVGDYGEQWDHLVYMGLLLREAETLIEASKSKTRLAN